VGKEVTGIILAGGSGKRMGSKNKAFLQLGDRPVIEWLLDRLNEVFNQILIVTDTPDFYRSYKDVRVTVDKIIKPQKSTLAGIHAGLYEMNTEYGFVVACDMPFINTKLIVEMISFCDGYDIIIPCHKGHVEATFALYHKNNLYFIEDSLARNDFKIVKFFPKVKVKYLDEGFIKKIDPEFDSFFNLNTPEDLEKANDKILKN